MRALRGRRLLKSPGVAESIDWANAKSSHEAADLAGELRAGPGNAGAKDPHFLLEARVLDEKVEAAAAQRVADLAAAVGGQHHVGHVLRAYGAELRNGDLKVGQDLQQEGFEPLV